MRHPWPPCAFRIDLSLAVDEVIEHPRWAWPYLVPIVARRLAQETGEAPQDLAALLTELLPEVPR